MGNGPKDATLANVVGNNMSMADQMYGQAFTARKAGTDYAMGTYKMGGFDQSAKYQAMQSGILDTLAKKGPGNFLNPEDLGGRAAMRAEGISNVGGQQLMAGMDEMNRIRGLLAGNGLMTTNFAQQEGQTSVQAASQMDFNPTMSTINAGLGVASAAYGGYKNQQKPSSSPSSSSQFGFGMTGSSMNNWASAPITSLVPPGQFSLTGGR
jgi:hypothetical protein